MLENLEQFEIQNPQLIYGGSIVEEDAEGF
jgi:hypothetical protein